MSLVLNLVVSSREMGLNSILQIFRSSRPAILFNCPRFNTFAPYWIFAYMNNISIENEYFFNRLVQVYYEVLVINLVQMNLIIFCWVLLWEEEFETRIIDDLVLELFRSIV
uniref:Unkown protein n=1 Tax=Riptortus pedestris TaxID=329032 RepID=R4WE90_RIPPE|nr:unkown protein [Riptortus pedestris]